MKMNQRWKVGGDQVLRNSESGRNKSREMFDTKRLRCSLGLSKCVVVGTSGLVRFFELPLDTWPEGEARLSYSLNFQGWRCVHGPSTNLGRHTMLCRPGIARMEMLL